MRDWNRNDTNLQVVKLKVIREKCLYTAHKISVCNQQGTQSSIIKNKYRLLKLSPFVVEFS